MKNANKDPTLWYLSWNISTRQVMKKAGDKKKPDAKMIAQIMTQISKKYKVATQAI